MLSCRSIRKGGRIGRLMRRIPAETILIGELVIGNDNKMNIVWRVDRAPLAALDTLAEPVPRRLRTCWRVPQSHAPVARNTDTGNRGIHGGRRGRPFPSVSIRTDPAMSVR